MVTKCILEASPLQDGNKVYFWKPLLHKMPTKHVSKPTPTQKTLFAGSWPPRAAPTEFSRYLLQNINLPNHIHYVSSIFSSTVVPFSAESMRYQFHLRLHNVVYIRRTSSRCHIARPLSFEQLPYHDQAVPPFVIWMRIIIVIIIIYHLDQQNLVRFPIPLAAGSDNSQVRWGPSPASSSWS